MVKIKGIAYRAVNNANGTWTLAAGTIPGGLPVGTYQVEVTVTSLAGNSSTEVKTLVIEAAPEVPATNANTGEVLSKTGMNLLAVGAAAGVVIVVAGIVLWRVLRHKN